MHHNVQFYDQNFHTLWKVEIFIIKSSVLAPTFVFSHKSRNLAMFVGVDCDSSTE